MTDPTLNFATAEIQSDAPAHPDVLALAARLTELELRLEDMAALVAHLTPKETP